MESMMMMLAQSGMIVAEVARAVDEYPQRIWNVILHHAAQAHAAMDLRFDLPDPIPATHTKSS